MDNLTAALTGFAVCFAVGTAATAVFRRSQGPVRENLLPGVVTSTAVAAYIYFVR